MRWQSERRSENVTDARGGMGRAALGGGGGLLLVGIVVALLGGDPTPFLTEGLHRTLQMRTEQSSIPQDEQNRLVDYISVVLGQTEDVWHQRFAALGLDYAEPKLVVFSGAAQTSCGQANAAIGPFYCPLDQTVYLDLEFFHELQTRFQAPGDFAQAYVVAHEIGHHVQNQLGILAHGGSKASSVRIELMADCLSGIWAHETQQKDLLDEGDIDEALNAASRIGDDVLQQQIKGYVVPDSFTHGSAAQRHAAFKIGFDRGSLDACGVAVAR